MSESFKGYIIQRRKRSPFFILTFFYAILLFKVWIPVSATLKKSLKRLHFSQSFQKNAELRKLSF